MRARQSKPKTIIAVASLILFPYTLYRFPVRTRHRFSGIHGEYGGSPNINFSPTYNITVSDAREFESMIKTNNTEMIAELKRMVI